MTSLRFGQSSVRGDGGGNADKSRGVWLSCHELCRDKANLHCMLHKHRAEEIILHQTVILHRTSRACRIS